MNKTDTDLCPHEDLNVSEESWIINNRSKKQQMIVCSKASNAVEQAK